MIRKEEWWGRRQRTRLDGAGNAVTSSGKTLAGLLGGGLLGVGGDCDAVSCLY